MGGIHIGRDMNEKLKNIGKVSKVLSRYARFPLKVGVITYSLLFIF